MRGILLPLRPLGRSTAGTVSVELALALPLLFVLLVAVVSLGQAVRFHEAAADGTRSATRYLTRVLDPCRTEQLDAAVGLALTRSMDWSQPLRLTRWPSRADWQAALPAAAAIDADPYTVDVGDGFRVVVSGCGAAEPDQLTVEIRFRYEDPLGLLSWIGLDGAGGFWIGARHQQRFIGI